MLNSIIVHPKLQISAFLPAYYYLTTSGAIKFGVPNKDPSPTMDCNFLLLPKSASLHTPFLSTKTFPPLISLCMTP